MREMSEPLAFKDSFFAYMKPFPGAEEDASAEHRARDMAVRTAALPARYKEDVFVMEAVRLLVYGFGPGSAPWNMFLEKLAAAKSLPASDDLVWGLLAEDIPEELMCQARDVDGRCVSPVTVKQAIIPYIAQAKWDELRKNGWPYAALAEKAAQTIDTVSLQPLIQFFIDRMSAAKYRFYTYAIARYGSDRQALALLTAADHAADPFLLKYKAIPLMGSVVLTVKPWKILDCLHEAGYGHATVILDRMLCTEAERGTVAFRFSSGPGIGDSGAEAPHGRQRQNIRHAIGAILFDRWLTGQEYPLHIWNNLFGSKLMRELIRGVVWQQGDNTFIHAGNRLVDCTGAPYMLHDGIPVCVASTFGMNDGVRRAWEARLLPGPPTILRYQLREPRYTMTDVKSDRVAGCGLQPELCLAKWIVVPSLFHDMVKSVCHDHTDIPFGPNAWLRAPVACDLKNNRLGTSTFGALEISRLDRFSNHLLFLLDLITWEDRTADPAILPLIRAMDTAGLQKMMKAALAEDQKTVLFRSAVLQEAHRAGLIAGTDLTL